MKPVEQIAHHAGHTNWQEIAGSFAQRLSTRFSIESEELRFLQELEVRSVDWGRGQLICRTGEPMRRLYVLKRGWAISYTGYADGSRQIRRLHLPGDLLSMPSLSLHHHAENIEAVTPVVLAPFDRSNLARMFDEYPRLAAIMYILAQEERVTCGDRLAAVGGMTCKERLAFLLVDIFERLRTVDSRITDSFPMYLTREQMGEMTGMTPVHASRMCSELQADGLIANAHHWVTLRDPPRLTELASYINRDSDLDFSWVSVIRPLRAFTPSAGANHSEYLTTRDSKFGH
jgi:CRP/FNR family transcriptional regulator, anaerobic regulatory protein